MNAWDCLNENEKKAVEILTSKLQGRFDVRDMRLFGSKVRGQAGPDSDVDSMIELAKRSPEIESEIDDITFEVNLRNDSFITTIVFGQDELQQGPMKESLSTRQSGRKESQFDCRGKSDRAGQISPETFHRKAEVAFSIKSSLGLLFFHLPSPEGTTFPLLSVLS